MRKLEDAEWRGLNIIDAKMYIGTKKLRPVKIIQAHPAEFLRYYIVADILSM